MLSRAMAKDKDKIASAVGGLDSERHFPGFDKTSWLVVFPEGTRMSRKALAASQRFMQEKGYAQEHTLRHLLCPRFKGTQMILHEGRKTFKAVYDVTIGYKPLPQFNNWRLPSEVHVHMQRIPMADVPASEGIQEWLLSRWKTKDELLKHFYETGSFPSPVGSTAGAVREIQGSLIRTLWTFAYVFGMNVMLTRYVWWRVIKMVWRATVMKK